VTGILLIAFALFSGEAMPETLRALLLLGGVVFLRDGIGLRRTRDPGSDYPYPAPDNPFNRHHR
jgi:hypothetical protein